MAKGGPPTLKGLLKKGKDKFGDSTPAYFDFLEAREEMLQNHQHLISSALEADLNSQSSSDLLNASTLSESPKTLPKNFPTAAATTSAKTSATLAPSPTNVSLAAASTFVLNSNKAPAAVLSTTLDLDSTSSPTEILCEPSVVDLVSESQSHSESQSESLKHSSLTAKSNSGPFEETLNSIASESSSNDLKAASPPPTNLNAYPAQDIGNTISDDPKGHETARLKAIQTEYKRSTNGVQNSVSIASSEELNGVQTEYKTNHESQFLTNKTEYKRSTKEAITDTQLSEGLEQKRVQTEYKKQNSHYQNSDNIRSLTDIGSINGVQTEYNNTLTGFPIEHAKESTNGVQKPFSQTVNPDINGVQTEYNPESSLKIKTEYKESTNGVQTHERLHIESSNVPHTEYKRSTKRVQTGNQTGNRTEYKQSTNLNYRLMGNQERFVLVTLFEIARQAGSLSTGPIRAALISEKVNIKVTTLKQVLKRICDKGFLIRDKENSQTGRGGVSAFVIPISLYQQILMDRDNGVQTEYKQSTIRSTIQSTIPSSKLVSNINTNLLEKSSERVLPEFVDCDISSLNSFGIYKKHLMDLHNQKREYTSSQMEQFIWKFSQYCSDSQRVKTVRNFPALFINMAQKLAEGYDPLEGLKTPEQELVAEQIEKNKKALFELRRQKEEAKELEYELWVEGLSRSERDELAPPNAIMDSGSELQLRSLRGYYEKTLWRG